MAEHWCTADAEARMCYDSGKYRMDMMQIYSGSTSTLCDAHNIKKDCTDESERNLSFDAEIAFLITNVKNFTPFETAGRCYVLACPASHVQSRGFVNTRDQRPTQPLWARIQCPSATTHGVAALDEKNPLKRQWISNDLLTTHCLLRARRLQVKKKIFIPNDLDSSREQLALFLFIPKWSNTFSNPQQHKRFC